MPDENVDRMAEIRQRATILAAAAPAPAVEPAAQAEDAPVDEVMPVDELDDGEELVTNIPVHGVAAVEGKPTGDGRGFKPGALSFGRLPAPLGYERVSTHGGSTSDVVVIGQIDEFWTAPSPDEEGVFEVRWRGFIDTTREDGAQAVQGIVDGSYDGVSIIIDSVTRDVSEERDRMRMQIEAEMGGGDSIDNMSVDELLDMVVGDGTTDVKWLTAARIRRFDMVPTGAFQEAYIALGSEFADELTDEQLAIAASALEDCGCLDDVEDLSTSMVVVERSDEHDTAVFGPFEGLEEAQAWIEKDATPGSGYAEYQPITVNRAITAAAFRDISTDERKKLAKESKALPDGSFPIANVADLRNAIQSIGRAKDPAAAKAHIKRRARDLGQEALIPKDWAADLEAFAPGTHDGPGWITHPQATSRIRRYWVRGAGAAKIAWGTPGDFNRCRAQLAKYVQNPDWLAGLCSNMHKEALGVWPGQEGGGKKGHALVAGATPAPLYTLIAAAEPLDASFFKRRQLDNPRVGVVVDGDAVYGYIAQWNVCHIGQPAGPGTCTMAPHSKSNYGMFRTGTVSTTEGPVAVGQLTMDTGHADIYQPARVAASHYDNTGAAIADVACGEDAFGIWFAGKIRPTATDSQRFALAASGRVSGDWRPIGANNELIAALVVNVPGFPIPDVALAASAGVGLTAILAAGIVRPEEIDEPYTPPTEGTATLSAVDIAGIAIAAAETVLASRDSGYVRPQVEDTAEDDTPITADLSSARTAFASRLLADARSAATLKGI